jgi:hypothetical protein
MKFLADLEAAAAMWKPKRTVEQVALYLNHAIRSTYDKHAPERRVEVKKKRSGKLSEALRLLRAERNNCRRNGKIYCFKDL